MKSLLHLAKKEFVTLIPFVNLRRAPTSREVQTLLSRNVVNNYQLHISRSLFISSIFDQNDESKTESKPISIDSFGAWDNNFELPLLMDASIHYGAPIPKIATADVGHSSINGKRDYQEDRFFIKDYSENLLCCAVFDGHGGSHCSEFCVNHIEDLIKEKLTDDCDLETLLHDSILQLNSEYTSWSIKNDIGSKSGSTCTICLLRKGVELAVANVGDSRALISRKGAPMSLTYDHCPSNVSERKRIEASGGHVVTDNIGRHMVNGALSMSRSIGDLHLKGVGVIPLPDTRRFRVKHGKDSFLLLTTDGINFVLRDEEICDVVNHAQDPSSAAHALTEQALTMSSEDNLTALVIPLGSWGKYAKSAASMFYSFGIGRDMSKSSRFG